MFLTPDKKCVICLVPRLVISQHFILVKEEKGGEILVKEGLCVLVGGTHVFFFFWKRKKALSAASSAFRRYVP